VVGDTRVKKVVETWHQIVAGERPSAGRAAGDDVVFYSPIAYTPQRGKAVTPMYLRATAQTPPGDPVHGALHYTKQVVVARLEFETTVVDKYVNGVDIVRCDETGHTSSSAG
jgi:hypothetical protein